MKQNPHYITTSLSILQKKIRKSFRLHKKLENTCIKKVENAVICTKSYKTTPKMFWWTDRVRNEMN